MPPSAQPATVRKIALRLLPFLFLLCIVAFLDRVNVSFAGLDMTRDLNFSDRVFGLGAGIFFIGGFLGPCAMGYLRSRTGSFAPGLMVLLACMAAAGMLVLLVPGRKEEKLAG